MKKSREDHAARFDEKAGEYDESKSDEYRACANLVVEHAAPESDDVVLDLGTGTGAIALALAPDAERVVGRDISEGMMNEARAKADEEGLENLEFGAGSFREPDYDDEVDVVTSNFALHHLSDAEKREAIDVIAGLEPRRFVLGDVMFFGEPDPDEPFYSPEVDDPATVGVLADAFTDAGFSLTAVERVHDQVGVLVAERTPTTAETDGVPLENDSSGDGGNEDDSDGSESVDGDAASGA
ncbi:class I SAM-dependent methyltransferase [Natronolimnohabitans innermongolicus]|uniref:Methyltransferase type 11 n=1 Tax=Natronolimnohabitans innermongolicus JCM 12255 TaxID=1227499 RepID=L9XK22_9EURY|nr:class I SAM-dependent methyltransferase [Natronolimnohabitans innermongolicus]ELY62119.1 methyltransferase type 11 [Natronolimnohabitans innermongolicus JCM 12255]